MIGSPPAKTSQRRSWERAVRSIERYRFDNRISGPELLGPEPDTKGPRREFKQASRDLVNARQKLGLEVLSWLWA